MTNDRMIIGFNRSTAQITQELRRQLEAVEAERAVREEHLAEVLETAGPARVALVEDLLDHFGIEPERTPRISRKTKEQVKNKAGEPQFNYSDRDETRRMKRLLAAIEDLIERAGVTAADAPDTDPVPPAAADGDEGADTAEHAVEHVEDSAGVVDEHEHGSDRSTGSDELPSYSSLHGTNG